MHRVAARVHGCTWLQELEVGTVRTSFLRPLPPPKSDQQRALWLSCLKVAGILLSRLATCLHYTTVHYTTLHYTTLHSANLLGGRIGRVLLPRRLVGQHGDHQDHQRHDRLRHHPARAPLLARVDSLPRREAPGMHYIHLDVQDHRTTGHHPYAPCLYPPPLPHGSTRNALTGRWCDATGVRP